MHRLGVALEQVDEFYQQLQNCPNVESDIGFISHFSCADETDCDYTQKQLEAFLQVTKDKKGERSIAASGGILFWENAHLDWIRPGIIMYGVLPDNSATHTQGPVPVMTLTSSLIAIRDHKRRTCRLWWYLDK